MAPPFKFVLDYFTKECIVTNIHNWPCAIVCLGYLKYLTVRFEL